jgi:hypothetical protein
MTGVHFHHHPALRRPALLAAFEGWNDAGEAATSALSAIGDAADAAVFAEIDAEDFIDYQVTRPVVRMGDDGARRLEWPQLRLSWAALPDAERDIVLLQGPEPNLRWPSFTTDVTRLAFDLGVGLVITVGALQVDVPHTRPVPVTGTATDAELGARLTLRRSGYEGPTGITGVLHAAAVGAGLDAVSLWAGVPHYLAATTYLPGAKALADRAQRLFGSALDLDELGEDADQQRAEIDDLVSDDGDLAEYVAELEARVDEQSREEASGHIGELPAPDVSGDELAAAFERYLRNRGDR